MNDQQPKILVLDIETSLMEVHSWGVFDQYIAVDDIIQDWSILSWSAMWLHETVVHQVDTRNQKNPRNDKSILKLLIKLINQADFIITKNGIRFDIPRINARIVANKLPKPRNFAQHDVERMIRKHFGFTSYSLAYVSNLINVKYKKLKHSKYPGKDLWKECLKGNRSAWNEMAKYNIHDVLATRETFEILQEWDDILVLHVFKKGIPVQCHCGSKSIKKYGYAYNLKGKFQRYACNKCDREIRGRKNLLLQGK